MYMYMYIGRSIDIYMYIASSIVSILSKGSARCSES